MSARQLNIKLDKVAQRLSKERLQVIIKRGGNAILAEAKSRTPFKSGALRRSLSMSDVSGGVVISSKLKYFRFVHQGTKFIPKRPFLAEAFDAKKSVVKDQIIKDIKRNLK